MRKNIFSAFLFLLVSAASFADTEADFKDANAFYKNREYQKAIRIYQKILDSGVESPELYFNIGNCFFKCDSNAKAILYYEKAALLSPDDEDIRFNLHLANLRNTDKVDAEINGLNNILKGFSESKTPDKWAWTTILSFILSLCLYATFLFFKSSWLKKAGFWGGCTFLFLTVIFWYLSHNQYVKFTKHESAIVMNTVVNVKSSPDENGKDIFTIHSGTKVSVINKEDGWVEVRLSENVGWIKATSIEFI